MIPDQPWVPPPVPDLPDNLEPERCRSCGVQLDGATGYICVRIDCPMGLGPTIILEGGTS